MAVPKANCASKCLFIGYREPVPFFCCSKIFPGSVFYSESKEAVISDLHTFVLMHVSGSMRSTHGLPIPHQLNQPYDYSLYSTETGYQTLCDYPLRSLVEETHLYMRSASARTNSFFLLISSNHITIKSPSSMASSSVVSVIKQMQGQNTA